MSTALNDIIETFQSVDPQMRLELLLDYSKRLPPVPEHLRRAADAADHQVHECMTPVFLWVERSGGNRASDSGGGGGGDDDRIAVHADVAEEAPTVKGYLSIVIEAISGGTAEDVAALPNDLLERLKLHDIIRMNRVLGLSAILARIKREVAAAATS